MGIVLNDVWGVVDRVGIFVLKVVENFVGHSNIMKFGGTKKVL